MPWRSERLISVPLLSLVLLVSVLATPSFGESDQTEKEATFVAEFNSLLTDSVESDGGGSSEDADQPAPEPEKVPTGLQKLTVHGFLTQGWADASFLDTPPGVASPTGVELALGIPEGGTTDYRFLAIQFRYAMAPKHNFVLQLSSRRLGMSPVELFEDAIELDWAFYEYRIGDFSAVKVGKVQIPYGIYNEIRDVGTILPFYRPPFSMYRNGTFTSETVDGFVLSHTFFGDTSWSIDGNIFGGEFDRLEIDAFEPENSVKVRAEDTYGFQFWLNTPYPSLRIGLGHINYRILGSVFLPEGEKTDWTPTYHLSVDATLFDRLVFQSEYQTINTTLDLPLGPVSVPLDLEFIDWYVQVGYRFTEKFSIWGQYDVIWEIVDSPILTRRDKSKGREDLGFALNFAFLPAVVLKAEYHELERSSFFWVPAGPMIEPLNYTADNGDYTIVSLSVSF